MKFYVGVCFLFIGLSLSASEKSISEKCDLRIKINSSESVFLRKNKKILSSLKSKGYNVVSNRKAYNTLSFIEYVKLKRCKVFAQQASGELKCVKKRSFWTPQVKLKTIDGNVVKVAGIKFVAAKVRPLDVKSEKVPSVMVETFGNNLDAVNKLPSCKK